MGTGQKMKWILKKQGKTIKWLSEKTGISLNTLYSITKRDSYSVSYPILKKVAVALDVSVSELLPEELKEGVDEMMIYMAENKPEKDLRKFEEFIVEEELRSVPYLQMDRAKEAADKCLVREMEGISDEFLKKEILEVFSILNRRGKIEAFFRIEELDELDEFHNHKK